jgi:hypothetical protein
MSPKLTLTALSSPEADLIGRMLNTTCNREDGSLVMLAMPPEVPLVGEPVLQLDGLTEYVRAESDLV